ncbi:hypothetical protein PHLCEN_2v13523 [Hermanssonia centrifuga]|uniref:Autophagy-related protein 11 n=1 Tax=Hermanssonia centrifuga TaxID=98765 RepID=A0A2R6NDZ9_9APHY|nr:hypothetical protein PHLCEN_2v13523 [Hermanssonia centrifuga]
MIQICRAEDGQLFEVRLKLGEIEATLLNYLQVDISIWDIDSLEHFIQKETGIEEDSILAYLSDGRRLMTENIRDLAGVQDQTIYVFNKTSLDLDLDLVLRRLRVVAPLQPSVEDTIVATPPFRPSYLASSYLRTANIHHDEVNGILRSLRYQHEALRIASTSLDLHVLAIQDAFEAIALGAQRELDKQESLLLGVDADLQIVSRVAIHKEFVSPAVRKAMELGERGRTLGDYVSHVKMRQVADACAKTHDDLRDRLRQAQDAMTRLRDGTDNVRTVVSDLSSLEDAQICARRSHDISTKIGDLAAALDKPASHSDRLVQDIRQLDASLRAEVESITQLKNSYTERCISALRETSVLNNYVVQLPSTLTSLQASFKAKTSFSHIQRLHNMLYAYGATVVEIVRRKEFAQFFYQRAQSILEVMAKLSANERKRRQVYRGEVHGQLPFDTKGMEGAVPAIDFSPSGSTDSPYDLQRTDVDDLMHVLEDLEHFARELTDPAAKSSIQEARASLEKLISKMDSLEAGFDRIAERSLLSSSRFLEHRRRSTEADEQAYSDLEHQLVQVSQAKTDQETKFDKERSTLLEELNRLREQVEDTDSSRDRMERDLHALKAQLESEATSRRISEQRNDEISSESGNIRKALADALSEATEQTKTAEILRQELAQVRAEFEAVKSLEQRNADKINNLLEEQANALRRLDEARSRGENLESQIQAARRESDDVKQALAEARKDKDRLLRAQASEHDRIMRDHIAEADGDRAVLEHQYLELKAALEDAQRQLKDARAQADMTNSDAVGLREELQRVEHEIREARHVERVLRDDIRAGRASQSDFEQRLESSSRLVAQILDVALAFRESHVKALKAAEAMTSHPPSKSVAGSSSMTESAFGGLRRSAVGYLGEPTPIDPSDPAAALEALRAFDHDQFMEAISKTGQTIRKWQKQCKDYREKAKGKISFRNFAKGDLALFLPTRNSVAKPWAAFNVSFPHYFLKATGHLEEQLKTREWIVARITSITEGVVDQKDASTNPYGLGDGVKYYMLEVEDWTQPSHTPKRRTPKKALSMLSHSEPPTTVTTPEPTPGPPDPDPEVEEPFPSRSPTSHLLSSRARGNSLPSARPSSLSRLLAQAPVETPVEIETIVPSRAHSPPPPTPSTPHPPPSPVRTTPTPQIGTAPLPLRSGSRASRISSSSRFSAGRIPFGTTGNAKAVATTALAAEQGVSASPSSVGSFNSPKSGSLSVSPEASPTEGLSNLLPHHRRRTSSYHPTRNSPLIGTVNLPSTSETSATVFNGVDGASNSAVAGLTARHRLASLASSWGVPFGRKKPSEPTASGSSGTLSRATVSQERILQKDS